MGVQSILAINALKTTATITTPATALAVFPAAGSISVITMLGAGDLHRLGEIQRQIENCINFARDNRLFEGAGADFFVAVKLNEPKASIRTGSLIAEVVTGDVAIAMDAAQAVGARQFIESTFIQCLDDLNEQDRLAA